MVFGDVFLDREKMQSACVTVFDVGESAAVVKRLFI